MSRSLVLSFVVLLSFNAQAQKNAKSTLSTTTSVSLHQQALAESVLKGEARESASDAQVSSGMLVLKDPRPEIVGRSWSYFVGFSAQSFQPEGFAKKDSNTFDLSEREQTWMPGLELGVLAPSFQTKALRWTAGIRAKGAFASQGGGVALNSGYVLDDARLNTTLLSAGPVIAAQWERLDWLSLTFSPQFGNVIYTQTTSNDYGKFTKQSGFTSMSYGLDFALGAKWSIFTEYSQRELNNDQELALQKDNFELGTKVTW